MRVAVISAAAAVVHAVVWALFARAAPEPYMDEIFHLPQTQRYCAGNWSSWDPNITTFPGTYVLGTLYSSVAGATADALLESTGPHGLCSLTMLRSLNGVLAVATVPLFHTLVRHLHPLSGPGTHASHPPRSLHALHTAVLCLYPVHFFFAFMYYTDAGSTFFVLLSYVLALPRRPRSLSATSSEPERHGDGGGAQLGRRRQSSGSVARLWWSALAGAIAVMFRQTNAVWVAFIAGTVVARLIHEKHAATGKLGRDVTLPTVLRLAARDICWLLGRIGGHAVVVVAFATFVVLNRGVVIGDRSNHEPVVHAAQLGYVSIVCLAVLAADCLCAHWWQQAWQRVTNSVSTPRRAAVSAVCMAACMCLLHWFSPVHQFLLADNRHYAFYAVKALRGRPAALRSLMAPVYAVAGGHVVARLRAAGNTQAWISVLFVATALVLVPAHLVEPRYFSVPVLLVLAHADQPSLVRLIVTALAFAAVNIVTVGVFLFRPFSWGDGSTARFMW